MLCERKKMIDRNHALPITHQAQVLGISRGAVYYVPRPISEPELTLMHRIDKLHLERPFMGARMLRRELSKEDIEVGRRHIGTLMRRMNLHSLAPPARYQQALPWAHDLPVPAAAYRDHARQSGLGARHHLHPDGERLHLFKRRD